MYFTHINEGELRKGKKKKHKFTRENGGICVGECKLIKINLKSLLYTILFSFNHSLLLFFFLLLND